MSMHERPGLIITHVAEGVHAWIVELWRVLEYLGCRAEVHDHDAIGVGFLITSVVLESFEPREQFGASLFLCGFNERARPQKLDAGWG